MLKLASAAALAATAFGASVVPQPNVLQTGDTEIEVSTTFMWGSNAPRMDTISEAFQMYSQVIFGHALFVAAPNPADGSGGGDDDGMPFVAELEVYMTDKTEDAPQMDTDESYELTVPADGSPANITAATVYGALRGLETFSQLVEFDFDEDKYVIRDAPVFVQDAPRFPHRGLLVDTSRHFLPVSTLRAVVDSMMYAKLNVLHLHVSDSQSFPFASQNEPALSKGAYAPSLRYSVQDMTNLVFYAQRRGVRVMVETDVPGHADSWCAGKPEICPSDSCLTPLSPATNETFDTIDSLMAEFDDIFPEQLYHLGGDEVNTDCWTQEDTGIPAWMDAQGMNTSEAYNYFVLRAADLALKHGHAPVNWDEVYFNSGTDLDPSTVVHVWRDKATLQDVVADGYRALLSEGWYLDHLSDSWQDYYRNDPLENITDAAQQALVLGGEGCMWGEKVDGSDEFQTVWPRAAAIAERLWSAADVTDEDDAAERFARFRCDTLLARGVAAAPLNNDEAREGPSGPGSCYDQ